MNKLFWNTTTHCRQLKNADFDVKNDVISGVLFHLKAFCPLVNYGMYDMVLS